MPEEDTDVNVRQNAPRTLAVMVVMLLGAGTLAWAAGTWTKTVDGSSEAKSDTMTFDFIASTVAAGDLFPSAGATGSIRFLLNNDNDYPIWVSGVALDGAATDIVPNTCLVTFGAPTISSEDPWYVVGPNSVKTIVVPDVLTMGLAATDACQGQTFTVPVSVTATAIHG